MEFTAKPGRVTLLQIAPKVAGFRMVVATGEALGLGGIRKEDFLHMQIKLDFPLDDFLDS